MKQVLSESCVKLENEYEYDNTGTLMRDSNRGISNIIYEINRVIKGHAF